ncbi:hypothetical protein EMCRGX_G014414 [Ephydatia muelleri]
MFLCGFINQATVQFHAYNPSGILFYQINSVMTDFLGVKLHGGLPWLIFDVGSGPAVVGSNSTRTFNDSQCHTHVSYPLLNGTSVQVEVAASQFVRSWSLTQEEVHVHLPLTGKSYKRPAWIFRLVCWDTASNWVY